MSVEVKYLDVEKGTSKISSSGNNHGGKYSGRKERVEGKG